MNYAEFASHEANGFRGDPCCECPACGDGGQFVEEMGPVFEALERARVVGVLDAWAEKLGTGYWHTTENWGEPEGKWLTCLHGPKDGPRTFLGATTDAARAAAAKAIEAGEVQS